MTACWIVGLLNCCIGADSAIELPIRTPKPMRLTVLAASSNLTERPYLAFPALLDLGDDVLISFKRGRSHAQDTGATLDLIRWDPAVAQVREHRTLAVLDRHILQMGEWVRFHNGDLACYIDTQIAGKTTTRTGLSVIRSADSGRTFGELQRVGVLDGVEYGYAFDAVTVGPTTWLLAMTFSNLTGGKSVYPPRPHAGAVHALRTEDNGVSWQFVRDLTHEFGNLPINESACIKHGDGWLVSTRGYDDRQRLHRTDAAFRLLQQTDLTATSPNVVASHLGRPRLFVRDSCVYLMGRNWTGSPRTMQLALFRLDSTSLTIAAAAILDNADLADVADGYYAAPFFRGAGPQTRLCVVNYKRPAGQRGPDILLHEFLWEDVR